MLGSFACCKGKHYVFMSICGWEAIVASVFYATWSSIFNSQWVSGSSLAPIYTSAAAPETGTSAPATALWAPCWKVLFLNTLPLWKIEIKLCPSLNYFTLYVTTVLQAMPWPRRLHFTSSLWPCFEAEGCSPSSDPETIPSSRHRLPQTDKWLLPGSK